MIYSKNHQKARDLLQDLNRSQCLHDRHINRFDNKLTELQKKKCSQGDIKRAEDAFLKMEEKYDARDNVAYRAYYDHMHKEFSNKKISENLKNYNDGFVDKQFVDDLYKEKNTKEQKNMTTTKKTTKTTKKPAVKKAPARKTVAKKPAVRKPIKKTASRTVTKKPTVSRAKTAVKKPVKRTVKTTARKTTARKTTARRTVAKRK